MGLARRKIGMHGKKIGKTDKNCHKLLREESCVTLLTRERGKSDETGLNWGEQTGRDGWTDRPRVLSMRQGCQRVCFDCVCVAVCLPDEKQKERQRVIEMLLWTHGPPAQNILFFSLWYYWLTTNSLFTPSSSRDRERESEGESSTTAQHFAFRLFFSCLRT